MNEINQQEVVAVSQTDATARDCMAEMAQRLRNILALDGLEDFLRTHRLPGAFFDEYRAALDAYDRYIAHIIAAEGLDVSCRAGCSACCRHELARGITLVEVLAIYRFVRGWPDIGPVYEAAGENAVVFQRLLREELRQDPAPLGADDPRVYSAHVAYNREERPCPFLDQAEGLCRIYPVRPLVCRWFHNLSPPQWCEPSHPQYLARNAVGVYPYREINDLMADIARRLGVATLNYLSGAFAHVAGDVLQGRPIAEA